MADTRNRTHAVLASAVLPSAAPASEKEGGKEMALVRLRDGRQLKGRLTHDLVELRTAYGDLSVPAEFVRSITLEDPTQPGSLDVVTTIYQDRFSGMLSPALGGLNLSQGSEGSVPRAIIQEIILPGDSPREQPPTQAIFLRNSDRLTGSIVRTPRLLQTPGGQAAHLNDLARIKWNYGSDGAILELIKLNGQSATATMEDEAVQFDLRIGARLEISTVRIASIDLAWKESSLAGAGKEAVSDTIQVDPPFQAPPDLVWIKPGKFLMGSPPEEKDRGLDELRQSEVEIKFGFWIGKFEVTQQEYQALMEKNPSHFAGEPMRPVEKVNWKEALEFCARLTRRHQEEKKIPDDWFYRLPTEAEWEYACRAGSETAFCYGDDPSYARLADYAWHLENSGSGTHPVGQRKPNAWGLFDMHGNVWEWCLDYQGNAPAEAGATSRASVSSLRGARGGSWLYEGRFCRSANRDDYFPSNRCSDLGFRVVLAAQ